MAWEGVKQRAYWTQPTSLGGRMASSTTVEVTGPTRSAVDRLPGPSRVRCDRVTHPTAGPCMQDEQMRGQFEYFHTKWTTYVY